MISAQKINFKNFNKVRALYHQAFPKIEKLPFGLILLMSLRRNIDFLAVYDEKLFIGLLYIVNSKENTLLYYFAVDENIRSKGYGSRILKWIMGNKKSSVSLIMETVHEECDNIEQRIQRKDFYLRNGFVDTKYYMKDYAGIFDILSTDKEINPKEFVSLIQGFTFWIRKVEVEKWN